MAEVDVVVVGGGPSGCGTALFPARYGLETVVFDCGRSSLKQCAYLENYPGFPAGIDVETLYELFHDQLRAAGCSVRAQRVAAVERADGAFGVDLGDGDRVTAERVVAATRYDGEYLRPLDEGEMFETVSHGGEEHERFDRAYPNEDGTTPIDGLYVASPSRGADKQAIVAAGRGARVGRRLVTDVRRARGYPTEVADRRDWMRVGAAMDEEWRGRDRWREWFDDRLPEDHGLEESRRVELRERDVDRLLETCLTDEQIEERIERGHRRLLEHIDDELVVERARAIEADRQTENGD